MAQPQSGILPDANPHATFLTLLVEAGAGNELRRICAAIPDLTADISGRHGGAAGIPDCGSGWRLLLSRFCPTSAPRSTTRLPARSNT